MEDRATGVCHQVSVQIGGMAIGLRTDNPSFLRMLEERYGGFLSASTRPDFEFEIDLAPPGKLSEDEDVRVVHDSGRWSIERGDFRAEWDPALGRGRIRQSINPYSIDSVLRIVHTLLLARSGGFLAHAASAVRNGRAFLFAGRSGAGKTTISRLAPPDVRLPLRANSPESERTSRLLWPRSIFSPKVLRIASSLWDRRRRGGLCSKISCSLPKTRSWSVWYSNRPASSSPASRSNAWCSYRIPGCGR